MGLKAGVKIETPCLTVNRLCGSGFQSVVNGAQEIQLKDAEIAVCAGAENMSLAPYILRGARFGTKLGTDLNVCFLFVIEASIVSLKYSSSLITIQ